MSERSNEQWLTALSQAGPLQEKALLDLRAILLRALRYALANRANVREDDLEDWAQIALLKILDALDTFRGESRFTTWTSKIAVRVAFSELRRLRWRDVSMDKVIQTSDGEFIPETLAEPTAGPEQRAIQRSVLQTLRQVIMEELTEKQRQALIAIRVHGMPLEQVAQRMDTNRNALYKLLYDARQQLQKRLQDKGLTSQEVLAAFGAGNG